MKAVLILLALCVVAVSAGTRWPPGGGPSEEVAIASKGYKYKYSKHAKHGKHHRETVKYEPSYKDKYTYPDNDGKDGGEGAGDDGSDPVATLCVAGKDVTVSGQPLNKQCPPPPNPNPANCEPIPNTCPNPAPTCSPTSCAPRCPAGQWTRFAAEQVKEHFDDQPRATMTDVRHSMYSCVDARGEDPMLGTPGGDLAEIVAATQALIRVRGKTHVTTHYLKEAADEVFYEFVNNVATAERPLYFHTDDSRLRAMFVYLKDQLSSGQPSIMPFQGKESEGAAWIEALQRPEFNGCGHIRLMLDPATSEYYGVAADVQAVTNCVGDVKDSECISAKVIAARMIENYFNFWWFTKPGSPERQQTAFFVDGVLGGPLLGAAVTIIGNKPAGGCPHQAPLVRPNFGASQTFVYHATAVTEWRGYVARTGFRSIIPEGETDAFIAEWNGIAALQLGATLAWLPPANAVGIFTVDVSVSAAGGDGHHHHHH